jgi:hypothetical protein
MSINHFASTRNALTFALATFFTVGCDAGSGSSIGSGPIGTQAQSRAHPSVFVSTSVEFKNDSSTTITGSGSATCWSISPSLPTLSAGHLSGDITLGYDTTCINGPNHLDITYGPTSGPYCTFVTTYASGHFTYEADNSPLTACTATASGTGEEIYTYALSGSLRRHR